MLGYDVDFGHLEFISLMASTKFSEKVVVVIVVLMLLFIVVVVMTLL